VIERDRRMEGWRERVEGRNEAGTEG